MIKSNASSISQVKFYKFFVEVHHSTNHTNFYLHDEFIEVIIINEWYAINICEIIFIFEIILGGFKFIFRKI